MVKAGKETDIRQNLTDAGCPAELIQAFMKAFETGALGDCCRLLDGHRRTLLDDIHTGEEKLTCLDYLRYQLKRWDLRNTRPIRRDLG